MSMGSPFDPLQAILASGGDVSMASAIARGNGKLRSNLLGRWLNAGLTQTGIDFIIDIAERAVNAGRAVTAMARDALIDLSIIPRNPFLFGNEGQGLRFFASSDYQLSPTGLWYRVDTELPDLMTPADIIDQVTAQAEWNTAKYPVKFRTKDGLDVTMSDLAIQIIIGRY